MKNVDYKVWLVAGFIILYSLFVVFVDYTFADYAEVLAATVFVFSLFGGFFISRQNDRFCEVSETITKRDATFSFLYRMAEGFPDIQDRVREIIIEHYLKIKKSGNWAYHTENPSTTITDLTNSFRKLDDPENIEDAGKPSMGAAAEIIWEAVKDLQQTRKKLVNLKNQKMLPFQWAIIYILALLLIVSLNFIPTPKEMYIDVLKVFFGTSIFLVVILLKQLNDLSLFGRKFTNKIADDVLWVVEEKDKEEFNILSDELKGKIDAARRKAEAEVEGMS